MRVQRNRCKSLYIKWLHISCPFLSRFLEGAGDVSYIGSAVVDQNADDVKTVVLASAAVAVDPALGGFGQFALLPAVDGLHRVAKIVAVTGFDLDKGDQPVLLGDQIDIAAAGTVTAGEDFVAATLEVARGDPFA